MGLPDPYFETKLGKLYHGDCLEILPHLEPVDLVLTDIPYGKVNRESNGLRNLYKGSADRTTFALSDYLNSIIGKSKSYYIFCGTEQVSEIRGRFVNSGLSTRLLIWEKTNPSPMNGEYLWLSSIECCVYGKESGAVFNEKCKSSVLRYPIAKNQIHETQKPVSLFQRIVTVSSKNNDCVLDTCLGSGTTPYVCERLNRKWIGIEIEEKYCEISAKRIEAELKQKKLPGF